MPYSTEIITVLNICNSKPVFYVPKAKNFI